MACLNVIEETSNMLLKLALISAMSLIAASPAVAQDGKLDFEYLAVDDPRAIDIWGEDYGEQDEKLGVREPKVLVAETTAPDGDTVIVSQFFGSISCGAMACPVRMVKDGEIVLDTVACDNAEMYEFGAGMKTLFLCDQVIPTGFKDNGE